MAASHYNWIKFKRWIIDEMGREVKDLRALGKHCKFRFYSLEEGYCDESTAKFSYLLMCFFCINVLLITL